MAANRIAGVSRQLPSLHIVAHGPDNPDTGRVETDWDLAGNMIRKVTPELRARILRALARYPDALQWADAHARVRAGDGRRGWQDGEHAVRAIGLGLREVKPVASETHQQRKLLDGRARRRPR